MSPPWYASARFVAEFRDFDALLDVADEVDRVFGLYATVCSLGGGGRHTQGTLYVDTRRPRADEAHSYAAALVEAARTSLDAYQSTLRP